MLSGDLFDTVADEDEFDLIGVVTGDFILFSLANRIHLSSLK